MKTKSRLSFFFLFAGLLVGTLFHDPVSGQIPAFPGAEGFGAYSLGGRGGTVYEVTNLNNNGPGYRPHSRRRVAVFHNSRKTRAATAHVTVRGWETPKGG